MGSGGRHHSITHLESSSLCAGCRDCSGCSVATSRIQTSAATQTLSCRSDLPAGLRRRAEFYRRELLPPQLLAWCMPLSSLLPARCWPRILPDKCDAQTPKTADLCLQMLLAQERPEAFIQLTCEGLSLQAASRSRP